MRIALEVIERGGSVVHATETCYGITCDLANSEAVAHLFRVKNRPVDQPVSVLFSSLAHAMEYGEFSAEALRLATLHFPGPLTIVVPVHSAAPRPIFVTGDGKTPAMIGVRISSHPTAIALAKGADTPIATTSANLHGKSNPYSLSDIEQQWQSHTPKPDLFIDDGVLPEVSPSTVVQVVGNAVRVLRQGDIVV